MAKHSFEDVAHFVGGEVFDAGDGLFDRQNPSVDEAGFDRALIAAMLRSFWRTSSQKSRPT